MAAKSKPEADKRTQRQKFIDKARELETDNDAFEKNLKAIATSPVKKTPAKKR
ncbi:MAG: hypothetical protein WBP38_06480 [Hyphomicrobium sp.]